MRVEVVKGSDLARAKEKFSKIMSEHLYSVHKSLADLELLASSGSGDINYSAIKCDVCKERSDEEMQLLRWGTAAKKITMENATNSKPINSMNPSKIEKNSMTAKKNGFNNLFNMAGKSRSPEKLKSSFQERDRDSIKEDKNFCKKKDSVEKDQVLMEETKEIIEKEKDIVEKDKNCIQEDKDSTEKIKSSAEKKKGSVANSATKKVSPQGNSMKKGSLTNFFGKQTSSKSMEVTSEKKNDSAREEFTERKVNEGKKKLQGKKRNRSKDSGETAKKRKRIVVQNDSSDSEIQSDIEMEEESVPETEPETLAKPKSPSPPRVKHENGKRKVLKLVNRTYKEGEYIVTKKEHVYVSCSEEEEEKEEEMKRKEKKAETKIEKVKKKQSTLTDFFKRS